MVRTHCVHSGTAGSPQKQVMTVAYWLVTLVQCGSSVRQWYACGTLVSHIYVHLCTGTVYHWYSGDPQSLLPSLLVIPWSHRSPTTSFTHFPLSWGSTVTDQHRGTLHRKKLSCFDIALILTLLSLSWTIMEFFHIFTHITNQKFY